MPTARALAVPEEGYWPTRRRSDYDSSNRGLHVQAVIAKAGPDLSKFRSGGKILWKGK